MELSANIVGGGVSRETMQRLEAYDALLRKWNPKINLVSRSTLEDTANRHFVDSAQLARFRGTARNWIDLGSGGGFPGLVLAVIFHEIAPKLEMTLVESDKRKAAFLSEVARATDIKVEVLPKRIEDVTAQNFDIVSARALAPLPTLLSMSFGLLSPGGKCVFLKGTQAAAELDDARKAWHFDHETHQSASSEGSSVLLIEGVRRV
ncbi:MAG: 16S rRNA (guanine(527)-N(7))-methyltransferase RsmG [Pseudomonadota bacterium]